LEIPPPGVGVDTVTSSVPIAEISVWKIDAVMPDVPTNIVGRELLFHCTVEQGNKLLPFTVSVNAIAPLTGAVITAASDGESGKEITGAARFVAGAVMEKFIEFDGTVPLVTVMATMPTNAVSAGVIAAVS
jgi:hypothetical protein